MYTVTDLPQTNQQFNRYCKRKGKTNTNRKKIKVCLSLSLSLSLPYLAWLLLYYQKWVI